jgi:uncharacterized membrane protein
VTAAQLEMSRPVYRVPCSPVPRWPGLRPSSLTRLMPLALLVVLVPARHSWAVQFLLIVLLFTVPGVILLRTLKVPGSAVASFPVYVPCASLVVLSGSALAVNLIGPIIGIAAPLRPWPMLIGLELVCLILLAVSVNAPPDVGIPWRDLPRPGRTALPLVLPLISAAGALRLNNEHGNGVAVLALAACVLTTIALFAYAPRLDGAVLAVGLYAAGLAMLWSFSLRGASVYGFDISDEYYVLQHTVAAGIWSPGHPNNAYAALLSVTVLPAELHAVTGISDLALFKIVYPALTALIPVAVFYLGRRILSPRWAFAAGALLITQSAFGQELPAVARQEIALVVFVGLVAAVLDTKLRWRTQWPLMLLFALTMVVSHYTTTYVAATLFGLTLVFQWVTSWFRPVAKLSVSMAVAFAAATAGAVMWFGPVTQSSSNVIQLAKTAEVQGVDLLPNRAQQGGLINAYLNGNAVTPLTPEQYTQQAHSEYVATKRFVHPLPDADNAAYALRSSTTPAPPVKWALGYNVLGLGELVAQQLIYLLSAIGALILVFRRAVEPIARRIGLITIATLVFLVAIRLSGTLATFYNAQRALLQAMVFLDIPLFWCLQALAGQRKLRQAAAVTAGAALIAAIFVPSNGLSAAVLGGGTATNLANSGNDYEQFYVTAPELSSATWLGTQLRSGQLVYTDEYGQLPLVSMTGISAGLLLDVTPQTLDQHAWVYATPTNVLLGQAHSSFEGHSISYVFPSRFLNANYNLVYTNGSSEVYHR